MKIIKILIPGISNLLFAIGCATGISATPLLADTAKIVVVEAKRALFDVMDKTKLIVDFSPNSAVLSESQKNDIKGLVKSLDVAPTNLKAALAGWSDQSFESGATLTSTDKNLAGKRLKVVASYINGIAKFKTVESFNMAEKSSLISRILGTDDADLKKEIAGQNTREVEMSSLATVLKKKGKVSSVVIVFYDESALLSH